MTAPDPKPLWIKDSEWNDKRRAKRRARHLREPGEDRVKARIVRVVSWRVDYADPEPILIRRDKMP